MNNMKLSEGIVANLEGTFGKLRFQTLHSVSYKRDEDDRPTSELDHRTYDLRSDVQKGAVQVILPGELPEKDIPYLVPVKLVNVKLEAYPSNGYRDTDATWIVRADDIVPIDAKAEGDAAKAGAAPQPGADAPKAGTAPQAKKG